MTDQPLSLEDQIELLTQQVRAMGRIMRGMGLLMGFDIVDQETAKALIEAGATPAAPTTVQTIDGPMSIEDTRAAMEASGMTQEEYADAFCACEAHTAKRAEAARKAGEIGLPE